MAKGFWIARVHVTDAEAYKEYLSLNGVAFAKYGGRFLVRGGAFETAVGVSRARNIVIEFPSYQSAIDCLNSPEYRRAAAVRDTGAEVDLIVIEGYDGPQPA